MKELSEWQSVVAWMPGTVGRDDVRRCSWWHPTWQRRWGGPPAIVDDSETRESAVSAAASRGIGERPLDGD